MAVKQDTGSALVEKSAAMMTAGEIQAEIATREAAKMTRRAALAKIGLRGGMAIFAAFSIDDLARKAATVLSQQGRDNKVVDEVARQMHNAGVSFAAVPPTDDTLYTDEPCIAEESTEPGAMSPCSGTKCKGACCQACKDNQSRVKKCAEVYAVCKGSPSVCAQEQIDCNQKSLEQFNKDFAGCGSCQCQNC